MKWISIKDKLPKMHEDVLVYVSVTNSKRKMLNSGFVTIDACWEQNKFHNDDKCGFKITHWMPLPVSPREVKS